jgi:hypothetical protein
MPTAREHNDMRKGTRVGDLGIEIVSVEPGRLTGRVTIRKELLSPNGFLHAGIVGNLMPLFADVRDDWPQLAVAIFPHQRLKRQIDRERR